MEFHHFVEHLICSRENAPERSILTNIRGQDDNPGRGFVIVQEIENVEAVAAVCELQVQYHDVRAVPRYQFYRGLAVCRFAEDLEAGNCIDNGTYAPDDLAGVFDDNQGLSGQGIPRSGGVARQSIGSGLSPKSAGAGKYRR